MNEREVLVCVESIAQLQMHLKSNLRELCASEKIKSKLREFCASYELKSKLREFCAAYEIKSKLREFCAFKNEIKNARVLCFENVIVDKKNFKVGGP